jgi:hypothetical protein
MYLWIAHERDMRRRMYRIRHPEPAPPAPFTASSTPGRVSMTSHQAPPPSTQPFASTSWNSSVTCGFTVVIGRAGGATP